MERHRQYAANVQQAAETLRHASPEEAVELLEQCQSLEGGPVRRGIEWDFLWSRANNADHLIPAHQGPIYALRFSPDSRFLVSAGQDGYVQVWDIGTWTKSLAFDDGIIDTNVAEFSPDGTLLAVAGDDGRVLVHRLPDGAIIYDEPVVNGRVYDVVWLGDDTRCAVGGEDGVLSIVDLISSSQRRMPALPQAEKRYADEPALKEEISTLAYLPESNAVAVGTSRRGPYVVDIATLEVIQPPLGTSGAGVVSYIPREGHYLACSTEELRLAVWNLDSHDFAADLGQHPHVRSLRYVRSPDLLAAVSQSGAVFTWQGSAVAAGRNAPLVYFSAGSKTFSGDISPDGTRIAIGGAMG